MRVRTSCTWMGMLSACRILYIVPAVQMSPCNHALVFGMVLVGTKPIPSVYEL